MIDTGPLEVDVPTAAAAARDGAPLVDVREAWEYQAGHAPGAELVPLGDLPGHVHRLPRDRRVYVICASGNRSLVAARALAEAGVDAVSVAGGTTAWQAAGQPVVQGSLPR